MSKLPNRIVVATGNAGKVREFRRLLESIDASIEGLDAHPSFEAAVEDADTFEGNAFKKASHAARVLGLPCLADDSGLVVDALGGAPGIYSARYAGEGASDAANVDKLLRALRDLEASGDEVPRSARFVCSLVLVSPTGERLAQAEGRLEGVIGKTRAGEGGFGYDPVFRPEGETCTLAELSLEAKNAMSHRAKACAALLQNFE